MPIARPQRLVRPLYWGSPMERLTSSSNVNLSWPPYWVLDASVAALPALLSLVVMMMILEGGASILGRKA